MKTILVLLLAATTFLSFSQTEGDMRWIDLNNHVQAYVDSTWVNIETIVDSSVMQVVNNSINVDSMSKYIFFAGACRNEGQGWYLIDDNDHTPINIDSVSNDAGWVHIYHKRMPIVSTMLVTTDETFSGMYSIGPTIGFTKSSFNIKKFNVQMMSITVTKGNSGWNATNHAGGGLVTVNYNATNKLITVTHDTCNFPPFVYNMSQTGRFENYCSGLAYEKSTFKMFDFVTHKAITPGVGDRFTFMRLKSLEPYVYNINPNYVINKWGNFNIIGIGLKYE